MLRELAAHEAAPVLTTLISHALFKLSKYPPQAEGIRASEHVGQEQYKDRCPMLPFGCWQEKIPNQQLAVLPTRRDSLILTPLLHCLFLPIKLFNLWAVLTRSWGSVLSFKGSPCNPLPPELHMNEIPCTYSALLAPLGATGPIPDFKRQTKMKQMNT